MTAHAYSGLDAHDRAAARQIVTHGIGILLAHRDAVHYTQEAGPRWEGINNHLLIAKGQFPRHGDCSSTHTWLLWNALALQFKLPDIVNGSHWLAGFTGTLLNHGKILHHIENAKIGDGVVYGPHGSTGEHVATYMGGGYVLSHGSEGGPYKLTWDYRKDFLSCRRYI